MNKKIVGIGGPKGSGKDTLAKSPIFKNYLKLAFADSLKQLCSKSFGLDMIIFTDEILKNMWFEQPFVVSFKHVHNFLKCIDSEKLSFFSALCIIKDLYGRTFSGPRHILQYIGTDIIRKYISETYLLDIIGKKIVESELDVIVTDMRFENERDLLKKLGGIKILVERISMSTDTHISEISLGSLNDYDLVITNNGTIDEFYKDLESKF